MDSGRRAFLLGRRPPPAAISSQPTGARAARIGEDCLARQGVFCRSCGDLCDTGAIAFIPRPGGIAQPEVRRERCTGCGDCSTACPTLAIAMLGVDSFPTRT